MPRASVYGKPKKVTSVSMPDGLYEFFRRYSGREKNASGGISLAILTVVQKDNGAKYLMAQVAQEGVFLPEDLALLTLGWGDSREGETQAKLLRERGAVYEAQLKTVSDRGIKTEAEENLPARIGAPLLFEQMSEKYMVSLTEGEMTFLDKMGTGKRPRSQGIRFLAKRLWELDPDAAAILCDIWREGGYFVPQLFVDAVCA